MEKAMLLLDAAFQVDANPLPGAAEVAKAAEALGFAALWAPETAHNPFLALTIAAEHTQQLTIGTAVAIAFPRSPMVTAQIAWDLAGFSGGRFVLGLGTQVKAHIERRFSSYGIRPSDGCAIISVRYAPSGTAGRPGEARLPWPVLPAYTYDAVLQPWPYRPSRHPDLYRRCEYRAGASGR